MSLLPSDSLSTERLTSFKRPLWPPEVSPEEVQFTGDLSIAQKGAGLTAVSHSTLTRTDI